ncbi:MAG: pyridoxamine 5'-phosphate oxidase family protein [Proteobacteria bacterium]|jgi:hypothetical protein|nr:pyridoxamine 5'-phosphate oxidase family protein [Pseudomonadota bacterium]
MATQYDSISDTLSDFIEQQNLFFIATADVDGRVNVSPKGANTLRVLGPNRVVWLNLTGSGNETAAHLLNLNRITLMFCSFGGKPMILRLYGTARTLHPRDSGWSELYSLFDENIGARQIYDVSVDSVQTSCGYQVPLFQFEADRENLQRWNANKGEAEIKSYWQELNVTSIDGKPTGING